MLISVDEKGLIWSGPQSFSPRAEAPKQSDHVLQCMPCSSMSHAMHNSNPNGNLDLCVSVSS